MRIYIIGNDGITLCREAPATVNDGEVAVASKAELHAAPLSGKRLLALWNALPGVEKRRTVGDRGALIDRLWPAIEALPDPELEPDAKRPSKQDEVIAMLRRPEGATVDEVARATGWQRHTVRGVFSGTLKKKLGLTLASAKEERGRVCCGATHCGSVPESVRRRPAMVRGMAATWNDYPAGACASLALGKVRGSAVAESSEFRQQVCETVVRLVAQPANRLGHIEPG